MDKKVIFIFIFLNLSTSFCYPGRFPTAQGPRDIRSVNNSDSQVINLSEATYLTLEEISQLALSNNFDIQLAQFDTQLKEADLDDVISIYDTVIEAQAKYRDDQKKKASTILGTRELTHSYNFSISKKMPTGTKFKLDFENERLWTNSPFTTFNPSHDSSLKMTLEQELGKNFFGIKDRSKVKITKIEIRNVGYTSLDKIEQTLAQVHKVYWKVAQLLNIVKIREEMLSLARKLFWINKEKIERGLIERPQLLASEANLRQKEIDLILAQNELAFALEELKLLLNIEDKDKVILPKEELGLTILPIELSQTLQAAFSNRRDYLKARNEVDSKRIELVMKKNNLWPEINLEASVARNGLDDHFPQAIEGISSEDNPEYFLSLKIKFPLENRQARSEFNKAKIEKAKALIKLKKIEREILVQINDSVRDCNILAQRAAKQKAITKLQEEKLKAELRRYQYGRSDTDTIIRYQDDLLLSRLLYEQALLDYKEALVELSLKENSLLDNFWRDEL
jgi:outer membrane protein TolC